MTDDFDVSLRRRLERLAAAVPVAEAGEVTVLVRQPVRARSTSRLALAAMLPVLAVVVIGVVVANVFEVGPGPADSSAGSTDAANGPIEATTRSGVYELTIRSAKARYAVDDPIDIAASLTFVGEELPGGVQIGHALGANEGPLGFGIEEPVIGDLRLTPGTEDACARTILVPGQPLTTTFAKSAGWSGDDPRSDDYLAFVQDPVLRLGGGTWHVYAVASFSPGDCGPDPVQMRVDLTIEVTVAEAPELRPSPQATPAPEPTRAPRTRSARDQADDGTLEIGIFTPRSRVHAGDPVTIYTHYGYIGPRERVQVHQSGPPVSFHLEQLDAGAATTIRTEVEAGSCRSSSLYSGDQAVAFGDVRLVSGDGVADGWLSRHFDGIRLRLPVGVWRVTAFLVTSTEACVDADQPDLLRVSIDFEVAPSEAGGIRLLTDTTPPTIDEACPINAASGTLAPHPASGLGLVLENGLPMPVRWPYDFSAEQGPEGAVLYDGNGFRHAVEGAHLNVSGSLGSDGVFSMCFPVGIALEVRRAKAKDPSIGTRLRFASWPFTNPRRRGSLRGLRRTSAAGRAIRPRRSGTSFSSWESGRGRPSSIWRLVPAS